MSIYDELQNNIKLNDIIKIYLDDGCEIVAYVRNLVLNHIIVEYIEYKQGTKYNSECNVGTNLNDIYIPYIKVIVYNYGRILKLNKIVKIYEQLN
jgi:hypothetical protein